MEPLLGHLSPFVSPERNATLIRERYRDYGREYNVPRVGSGGDTNASSLPFTHSLFTLLLVSFYSLSQSSATLYPLPRVILFSYGNPQQDQRLFYSLTRSIADERKIDIRRAFHRLRRELSHTLIYIPLLPIYTSSFPAIAAVGSNERKGEKLSSIERSGPFPITTRRRGARPILRQL